MSQCTIDFYPIILLCSTISYWHHHVVRLSVTLCIVALAVGVQG